MESDCAHFGLLQALNGAMYRDTFKDALANLVRANESAAARAGGGVASTPHQPSAATVAAARRPVEAGSHSVEPTLVGGAGRAAPEQQGRLDAHVVARYLKVA